MSEIENWLESKKQGVIKEIVVDVVRQIKSEIGTYKVRS
jgi:hypothetical protein